MNKLPYIDLGVSAIISLMMIYFLYPGIVCVDGVTYELTVTADKVFLGQSLTISVKVNNPSIPVGDVSIVLTKPLDGGGTIFQYREKDNIACQFSFPPYTTSGRVDVCDNTNHRYTITFPSVTEDHIGRYRIEAPLQNPYESNKVEVQLLGE